MHYKTFLVLSYLTLLAVLFSAPPIVLVSTIESNLTNFHEIAHVKASQQKAMGVMSEVQSGLPTVKTATSSTLTSTESAAAGKKHQAPQIGDH